MMIASKGLIVDMPLNEGQGKLAFDKTKLTNPIGIPVISSTITWQQSQKGNSLKWAGSTINDKVTIGKPSILNIGSGEVTVSLWCRFTAVSSVYRYLVSDYNSAGSNCQYSLMLGNVGRIQFFWCNAGSQVPTTSSTAGYVINANQWYHLVGIRSGVAGAWTAAVWQDGVFQYSQTTATNPPAQSSCGNTQVGIVGDYNGPTLCHDGNIRKLKVWNRALTPSEIKDLFVQEKNFIR